MAVLIYENGLVEETKPEGNVFTDNEILNKFSEADKIRSKRLVEVPNSWCLWGEKNNPNQNNFNNLASTMIDDNVFSKMLVIHDTEIDPNWRLIDTPIYENYNQFRDEISALIEYVAQDIIETNNQYNKQVQNSSQSSAENLMILNTVGPTKDKRILFELDLKKQDKNFFNPENFGKFAHKVYEYLTNNRKEKDNQFVAFANQQIIIIVRKKQIEEFTNKLLEFFTHKEEYEKCAKLKEIQEEWSEKVEKKTKDSSTNNK